MSELNLPVDMFEEIFKNMHPMEISKFALINKNAKKAADKLIQRILDSIYQQYAGGSNLMFRNNVLLTKRINRNWAVQICRTTSDSQGKMFYKINLVLYMRIQISESRFIDMAYPKQ
jgi:hypothetical protein